MTKYAIGVDYGTLSLRALLVNVDTGEEIYTAEQVYPHGVMDTALPDGTPLPPDWALQVPSDYLDGFVTAIRDILEHSGVVAEQIVGIGLDFTACTILPTDDRYRPLCEDPCFAGNPHAYAKLWKHHAAQPQTDELNALATETVQPWLELYGGKISCEWMLPKVMQILDEAPEVYRAAGRILEAGDWMVTMLCGEEKRSACQAGYKALWNAQTGYPAPAFLKALRPEMESLERDKLGPVYPMGTRAGTITPAMAQRTGLSVDTAVAVALIDAHASVPACGIAEPGQMLMIMGTSTCHIMLGAEQKPVPGISGVVKDGILPGCYAYEAGQACVGDAFSWFVHNGVPAAYEREAQERGMAIHALLREKAEKLAVGQSGLIALDWWNGVRSTLVDAELSGAMFGYTLQTKPEEIYRALLESTAYGTRYIMDAFESAGVPIPELYAAGGIAEKDPLTMQIYADVCGREIRISGSRQSGALGSAIFGALAAGCGTAAELTRRLGKLKEQVYRPDPENQRKYARLYAEYCRLYDYFGRGENPVLKTLRRGRTQ